MKLADKMNGPIWIVWAVAAILIALSIVFISGRASGFLAGYSTASKEEKEKYDEKKLCRITGYGMAVIAVLTLMTALLNKVLPAGFTYVFFAIIIIDCVVLIILGNTICKK